MVISGGALFEPNDGVGIGFPAPRQLLHRRLPDLPEIILGGALFEPDNRVRIGFPAPRQLLDSSYSYSRNLRSLIAPRFVVVGEVEPSESYEPATRHGPNIMD